LLDILTEAGFVLRQPGCSACLAMNDDKVPAGKYSVSTSNRKRDVKAGSRTLLASPSSSSSYWKILIQEIYSSRKSIVIATISKK
jgi:homoaconitase/3-isopropylmalate dehydratase large subunit